MIFKKTSGPYTIENHEITLTLKQKLRVLLHHTDACHAYLVFCNMREQKCSPPRLSPTAGYPSASFIAFCQVFLTLYNFRVPIILLAGETHCQSKDSCLTHHEAFLYFVLHFCRSNKLLKRRKKQLPNNSTLQHLNIQGS